jgi:3-O-methylgallate 3,4-dioxygenase
MSERFDQAMAAMEELHKRIRAAKLDVLLVVGDDQTELFRTTNTPAFAIYHGETIRNAMRVVDPEDSWFVRARAERQEPSGDVYYPVKADMAKWLIRQLCDRDFDIAAMEGLEQNDYEGHAFSFIHRRYLQDIGVPVIPVIINTFDPPNQPTPHRCVQLGNALRELIAAWPGDLRVGIMASGGLSHFIVEEKLDNDIIDALRRKDTDWLSALDPKKLMAGSSEIRNWLVAAGALTDLDLEWVSYTAGYRTPALTGTGLGFAAWHTLD